MSNRLLPTVVYTCSGGIHASLSREIRIGQSPDKDGDIALEVVDLREDDPNCVVCYCDRESLRRLRDAVIQTLDRTERAINE